MPILLVVRSRQTDPWRNLALEDYLVSAVAGSAGRPDELAGVLYLWQNHDTVVIGRNQNAWAECQAALLESEGGRLARRTTGGGAVFHDAGNLNFSLIVPRRTFDLDANFALIARAAASQGIAAERSGRNDILADGRKFSGNAFSLREGAGLHHGTLLVSSDFGRLARYLTVDAAKLRAKGVTSVRSRVINLAELNPSITVASMDQAMEDAFLSAFLPPECDNSWQVCQASDGDFTHDPDLQRLTAQFSSWDWRYGESITFDVTAARRLDWGSVEVGLQIRQGRVDQIKLYSDALDSDFIECLRNALNGCRFHSADLAQALLATPGQDGGFGPSRRQMASDLADLLSEQHW